MNWQLTEQVLSYSPFVAAERAALRRYLPYALAERILSSDAPPLTGDLSLALIHLASLLHTISTYLPLSLVQHRLSQPTEDLVWGEVVEGTLVFADVSGFTAMSEKLAAHGREGAEVMTEVVNKIFAAVLEPVTIYGGELLKFGGDGALCSFQGDEHPLRGSTAALTIQQRMADLATVTTPLGVFPLAMSIGINSGSFFMASVGTTTAADCWTTGTVVNDAVRVRASCRPGCILLGESTWQELLGRGKMSPYKEFYELEELPPVKPAESLNFIVPVDLLSPETFAVQISAFLERIEALHPYLPAGLMDKLIMEPQQPSLEGEHRRVTSCFVNIVGFSDLVTSLGAYAPTDLAMLLNRYFTAMQEVVHGCGGVINKIDLASEGSRLLTIFGAPTSHEDDPERAAGAAFEMNQALTKVNADVQEFLTSLDGRRRADALNSSSRSPLAQRIGLSTGHAFTGNVGAPERKEYTVMGDAVILAARLMECAQMGEIYLDAGTAGRAAEKFTCVPLPPIQLRGKIEPVAVYSLQERCKGGLAYEGRALSQQPGQSPFVNRSKEKTILERVMAEALAGRGQVVTVSGAAGIGKSRLVGEAKEWWREKHGIIYEGDCRSYGRSIPYLPWTDVFRAFFELRPEDPLADQRGKIVERMSSLRPDLVELAPLIGEFLAVPIPAVEWLDSLSGDLRRTRLFDVLADLLSVDPLHHCVLVVLENWHWADVASLQLLEHISQRLAHRSICICLVQRPGEEPVAPLQIGMPHTLLALDELSREDSSELIRATLQGARVSGDAMNLVWNRTQGNPFFIEEVLHTLLENNRLIREGDSYRLVGRPEQTVVPETIQEVLMARLDRLQEPAHDLLRVASVIGPTFSAGLLQELLPTYVESLEQQLYLTELSNRGLIYLEAPEPEPRYRFSQPLIQEVIYESLPFTRRRALHGQVAEMLERHYIRGLEESPILEPDTYDELAYHYARSAQRTKAVEYSFKAGERARMAYANEPALTYYAQALSILEDESDKATPAARRQYLLKRYDILMARERVLNLLGRRDAQRADLDEMMYIAETLNDMQRLSEVTNRLSVFHRRVGRYREAMQAATAGLALKRQLGDQAGEGESLYLLAGACRHLDEMDRAQQFYEEALAVAREVGDAEAECHRLNGLGTFYWGLGALKRAQEHLEMALSVARHSGNRQGEGISLGNLGLIYAARGEYEWALSCFDRGLEIALDIGDRLTQGTCQAERGLLYGRLGLWEEALENLGWALVVARRARDRQGEAIRFYYLGLVNTWAGNEITALEVLSRGLFIARSLSDRRVESDIHHGFGLAYLGQGDYEAALNSFNQAMRLRGLVDQRGELVQDLLCLALAHLGQKELEDALRCSRAAITLLEGEGAPQILEEMGGSDEDSGEAGLSLRIVVPEPQQLIYNHVLVLQAVGADVEAREYLEKAQRILSARAQRIQDPGLRSSYLDNVLENRWIMEAWNRSGS
jgi:class 3 adenylate cyclase/tetratricopeptide (TPR) repeat protein